jgi:hypothetical protein
VKALQDSILEVLGLFSGQVAQNSQVDSSTKNTSMQSKSQLKAGDRNGILQLVEVFVFVVISYPPASPQKRRK